MQVENVTRVCFTARRTTQQQGDLAIGHSLLGQIIIDDQGVFTAVTEVFTHGRAGVGCQELHRCRIGGAGGNHDGVIHSTMLFQLAHNRGNGRLLLANCHVDTLDARIFLVDDRVDGDGGLTDLAVTDDQLTLATTDWYHGVNGFQTGLDRLINGLTSDNTGSHFLDR